MCMCGRTGGGDDEKELGCNIPSHGDVCVAKIEAWHQLLDLTRVGEGMGESGKMKHAYTTWAHTSLYISLRLSFFLFWCLYFCQVEPFPLV